MVGVDVRDEHALHVFHVRFRRPRSPAFQGVEGFLGVPPGVDEVGARSVSKT